jgi:hypothetical protein
LGPKRNRLGSWAEVEVEVEEGLVAVEVEGDVEEGVLSVE